MSEAKFTKGEWKPNALVNGRGFDISFNDDGECITEIVHTESDAHLIAAAPDMYKLLEACEKTFTALYPTEVKHVQPEHYPEFKAVHHLIGSIKNELSKARGE